MKTIRSIVFLLVALTASFSGIAQNDHVKWSFSTKKLSPGKYRLTMQAKIEDGWHIYSIKQPPDIGFPPKFTFGKNPLIVLSGAVTEVGNDDGSSERVRSAEFYQDIELRASVKTNLTGNIKYQVCTDETCVFPPDVSINIPIQ